MFECMWKINYDELNKKELIKIAKEQDDKIVQLKGSLKIKEVNANELEKMRNEKIDASMENIKLKLELNNIKKKLPIKEMLTLLEEKEKNDKLLASRIEVEKFNKMLLGGKQ